MKSLSARHIQIISAGTIALVILCSRAMLPSRSAMVLEAPLRTGKTVTVALSPFLATDRSGGTNSAMNLRQDIGALKPPIQTAASFTVSPRVQSILQNAEKLGRLSPDATAENLNLQNVAKSLTSDDAKQLLQVMLRPGEFKSSQRSLSVFLLAQRPENFSNELSTIAADSNELLVKKTTAHSEADALKIFEVSLRLEALDALDQLNGNGSSQSQELIFTRVQNSTHHPLIAKVASIGRAGARAHRALIASFIQHNLAPALRETSNVD